jgi:hypothetical protein
MVGPLSDVLPEVEPLSEDVDEDEDEPLSEEVVPDDVLFDVLVALRAAWVSAHATAATAAEPIALAAAIATVTAVARRSPLSRSDIVAPSHRCSGYDHGAGPGCVFPVRRPSAGCGRGTQAGHRYRTTRPYRTDRALLL